MSPYTLKDYEMTENAKESSNCEATTGAAGAETTEEQLRARCEAATVVAGAEAMEVATEGEAATVAAGASGDATYGSHLPYCRANVDHVPLALTNDQLPIYAVNAGKEKWTKRQYTLHRNHTYRSAARSFSEEVCHCRRPVMRRLIT